MTPGDFIPTGRTSLVSRGDDKLQLQTEYAVHPQPRITTTISQNGQVVHKVERRLDRPVSSLEEQRQTQKDMLRQHAEVEDIIRRSPIPGTAASPPQPDPVVQRLRGIPGIEHVYRLDNDGNFHGEGAEKQFRGAFSTIYKGLQEVLDIFSRYRGDPARRESGVYEVERGRLYLISEGSGCIFVTVRSTDSKTDFESKLARAVLPNRF